MHICKAADIIFLAEDITWSVLCRIWWLTGVCCIWFQYKMWEFPWFCCGVLCSLCVSVWGFQICHDLCCKSSPCFFNWKSINSFISLVNATLKLAGCADFSVKPSYMVICFSFSVSLSQSWNLNVYEEKIWMYLTSLFGEWHLFIRVGEISRLCILKAQKARKVWKIALVLVFFFFR